MKTEKIGCVIAQNQKIIVIYKIDCFLVYLFFINKFIMPRKILHHFSFQTPKIVILLCKKIIRNYINEESNKKKVK